MVTAIVTAMPATLMLKNLTWPAAKNFDKLLISDPTWPFPKIDCTEMLPKAASGRYAEKSMLPGPVLCLYWACLGMVWGTVSSATRQTPQIDDNTPARGGIMMYNGGLAGG